jgi:hypothetical protein
VCGSCSRANRPDDCEYTDGQGQTRTQMLEDTIAQLEARIQELEHPGSSPGSVTLHDPRSTFFQTQLSPLIGPSLPSSSVLLPQAEFSHGPHSSASPASPSRGESFVLVPALISIFDRCCWINHPVFRLDGVVTLRGAADPHCTRNVRESVT